MFVLVIPLPLSRGEEVTLEVLAEEFKQKQKFDPTELPLVSGQFCIFFSSFKILRRAINSIAAVFRLVKSLSVPITANGISFAFSLRVLVTSGSVGKTKYANASPVFGLVINDSDTLVLNLFKSFVVAQRIVPVL